MDFGECAEAGFDRKAQGEAEAPSAEHRRPEKKKNPGVSRGLFFIGTAGFEPAAP